MEYWQGGTLVERVVRVPCYCCLYIDGAAAPVADFPCLALAFAASFCAFLASFFSSFFDGPREPMDDPSFPHSLLLAVLYRMR